MRLPSRRLFFQCLLACLACLPLALEALTLASWNARNYLLSNRWHDGAYRFEYPKPEAEKTALRRILTEVRPDILLLQEIGSPPFLKELQDDLAHDGLLYVHSAFTAIPGSRTGLACLSRYPIELALLMVPDPTEGDDRAAIIRGLQELSLRVGNQRLRLFHCHLKSRYTTHKDDPESRRFRCAEVEVLAELLEPRIRLAGPRETLILAGDFNTPFADPLLDQLRSTWRPVDLTDASGQAWTYHHRKSDRHDRIDGFWVPVSHPQPDLEPVGLFPAYALPPDGSAPASDHRLVVVSWDPDERS